MIRSQTTKDIGRLGEQIASDYLKKYKLTIINRNYWKKWGELDIVARETEGKVHFIEVKAVSYETKADLKQSVTHETWRPEEQVHERKMHQIHKALESWLTEYNYVGDWQIDVVAVRMVVGEKFATVKWLKNVV